MEQIKNDLADLQLLAEDFLVKGPDDSGHYYIRHNKTEEIVVMFSYSETLSFLKGYLYASVKLKKPKTQSLKDRWLDKLGLCRKPIKSTYIYHAYNNMWERKRFKRGIKRIDLPDEVWKYFIEHPLHYFYYPDNQITIDA